jgi:hypothetical protein
MKSGKIWQIVVVFAWLLLASEYPAWAQESDSTNNEIRLLRTTNDRLARENDALRAEIDALRKRLVEGEPTTRPAALSAGGGGTAPAPAKRIVFIMDGSGSMLNQIDRERDDVRRQIEELKPDQLFAVVFDQEDGFNPFPNGLVPATQENKSRVLSLFPKLYARGTDNFTTSLKAALAMNPDLIWWIGDAPQNRPSDLSDIKKWNTRKVKINTSPRNLNQDRDGSTAWFAWKVASDSGGTCFDETGQAVTAAPPEPPLPPAPPQPKVELKGDGTR